MKHDEIAIWIGISDFQLLAVARRSDDRHAYVALTGKNKGSD